MNLVNPSSLSGTKRDREEGLTLICAMTHCKEILFCIKMQKDLQF